MAAVGAVALSLRFGAACRVRGEAQEIRAEEDRVEALRTQANRNAFSPPPGHRIDEGRLLKLLDVRREIFAVYEKHRRRLEEASKDPEPGIADLEDAMGLIQELRLVQAKALADAGMSEAEYGYLVDQVYKTAWAVDAAPAAGSRLPSPRSSPRTWRSSASTRRRSGSTR